MSEHGERILLIAAYGAIPAATANFDRLAAQVKQGAIGSEGLILVSHDAQGQVSVRETRDHLGRRGMGWGGGVGLLVGLFAPHLLASVVVGAAAGALIARFARQRLESGIEKELGERLPPGGAAILTIVNAADRLAAEQALADSPAKSVAAIEGVGLLGLRQAMEEAGGKFNPDRTVLPIPDRNFGGPKAPDGAPNVLVVLIDDAGFGGPSTFGGGIDAPTFSRVQQMGLTYNRFHVTAVCSPTPAAMLTGRNHHRVGFGSIAEYPGPFPGYTAARPRSCTAMRILQENGYVTGSFGKWHPTPDNVQGTAGPFDH